MKVVNSVERSGPVGGCGTGMCSLNPKTRLARKRCITTAGRARNVRRPARVSSARLTTLTQSISADQRKRKLMLKILQSVHPLILLVIATTLEVSGDAVVRMAIYNHVGAIRIALFLAGAALLF